MSFCIALQSAIFYVVACTPCLQAREIRQNKRQAQLDRAEKSRRFAERPDEYQHPDPFNTNPYWSEEIQAGPSLPKGRRVGSQATSQNTSQKRLNSAGRDSRSTAGSSIAISSSHIDSSPTVVPEDEELDFSASGSCSDDWNKKRYQREDEELWGREISKPAHKLMDAIKQAGSSAGRIIEAKLGMDPKPITEEDRAKFYSPARIPSVNDYHPPVVSQRPKNKDAARWMLQPPPPAKVMEGKVPVSRSTSLGSQASRRTMTSETHSLGKLIHSKTVEAKLRRGELPEDDDTPSGSKRPAVTRRNTSASRGRRSPRAASKTKSRSRSLSIDSIDGSDELRPQLLARQMNRKSKTPADYDSSDDEFFVPARSFDSLGPVTRAAHRPKLETIISADTGEAGTRSRSLKRRSRRTSNLFLDSNRLPASNLSSSPPNSTLSPLKDISNTSATATKTAAGISISTTELPKPVEP